MFFAIFAILITSVFLTKIFDKSSTNYKSLKTTLLLKSCAHWAWLEWCQWMEVMSKFVGVQRKISKLRDSGPQLALQLTDWQGLIIKSQMFSTHSRVPLSDNFHFLGRNICEDVVKTCDNLAIVDEAQLTKLGKWAFHDIRQAILCTLCSTNYLQKACLSVNTVLQVMKKGKTIEKARLLISFEHI